MLSSSDVAQMMAAQNSMFMGQQQYAQQIGIPSPNMSLGAFGSDPRQRAFGPQGTFGGHSPVSYAQGGAAGGYGGGNRVAGGMMSAAGGVASGLSMLAFDPISAFAKGAGFAPKIFGAGGMSGGIGAMAGGGIMGGMAAAAPPMLMAMAAQKAIGAFVGGGQEQQAIGQQLGGFGFANSRSRTGQGFTRDDAQMIGNQVRAIAHIPEMMTSVEELTKLIPRLKSSGVMSGVRDASEFNSRFKEAVKTLRDVSRVMGTTMEEASKFFEHSRSVGYLGRTDQIKNAMNVKFTAAQTGMSEGQVMQMQQGGAQMAVNRGVRRNIGATAVTNISQQIGRGMQMGNVSQADLEDMTGAQGEAAVGAAAQQMTEKLARFAESTAAGKASMMGLAEFDDKGRFKGINKELAQRYAAGEIPKEELMKRIAGFTGAQKIAASRKVGSMAIEFAGATGPGGSYSFIKNVLGDAGYGDEAAKLVMQRQGFTEVEVDFMEQMQGTGSGVGEDRQKKAFERKQRMRADIADRTDPSKIMSRIGTKLKSGVGLARAEQEGAKYFTAIGKAYDEFIDDIVGNYSAELSEKGAQRLLQSLQSNKGKEDMKALFAMKTPQYTTANSASSFGKGLAGFQMGVEAIATGGLSLGVSAITGQGLNERGKQWDKAGRAVGRFFGTAAFESAGDVEMQKEYVQEQFSMQGKGSDEINDRFKKLKSMGAGEENEGAREQVNDAIRKLNANGGKFRDASQADRLKMLTEELEDRTSTLGLGGDKVKKVQEFMKKNNLKSMSEAAMALAKGSAFSTDFSDVEASIREQGREHAKSIQAADTHLASSEVGLSDAAAKTVSAAIASDFQIGTNLRESLTKPEVKAALDMSGEEGARALEVALGRPKGSISMDEFKKTQEASDKVEDSLFGLSPEDRKKKEAGIISAIASRQVAEETKDIGVTQIAARDLVSGMGDGEAKAAFKAFANEKDPEKAHKKMWELQDVMSKQAGRLSSAKKELDAAKNSGDKGRVAAAEKQVKGIEEELGGELTRRITGAVKQFDSESKEVAGSTMSTAAIAKQFGMSEDVLTKQLGLSGETKLTKDVIEKIKSKKVGAQVAGGALVSDEAQVKEARDNKLDKTLTDLNTTMAKTNTLLAMSTGMSKTEAEKTYGQSQESKDIKKGSEGAGGKKTE